jgi:nicotinate-nucleotide adenylyltransferase
MAKAIGVFGSAFDPIHFGHIDCLQQIKNTYERIIVVPSYAHAFGKQMADYDLRMQSVALAVKETCDAFVNRIVVSDIERTIAQQKQDSPVYTFDVLRAIAEKYGTDDIDFVVGPDNADPMQWARFYRSQDILKRWGIQPVKERCKIRSSFIRQRLSENNSLEELSRVLPETVLNIIKQNNLYGYTR